MQKAYLITSLKSQSPVLFGGVVLSIIIFISLEIAHTAPMKLIAFIYIFIRLAQTASDAAGTGTHLRMNKTYISELFRNFIKLKEHAEEQKITDIEDSLKIHQINTIQLKDVTFSYPGSKPILEHFSLTINRGDIVLIKGESGAGKSTLLSLILGIAKPQSGKIIFNEHELTSSKMISDIIGYVGPEPYIIPGSITDNLLYGNFENKIPEDKAIKSLQMAQLWNVVRSLSNGLNTELSEHTELSTGQKQRLAIARALSRSPSLLILDEATANLDLINESEIIDNLSNFKSGLTMIIISHKNTFEKIATKTINLGS